MKKKESHLILYYKSRLFDLMKIRANSNMDDWMSVVSDCLHAEMILFYKQDMENTKFYKISSFYNPFQHPVKNKLPSKKVKSFMQGFPVVDQATLQTDPYFSKFNIAFFIPDQEMEDGCLFLSIPDHIYDSLIHTDLHTFVLESRKFLQLKYRLAVVENDRKQYIELFHVTEKFHSSMDTDTILSETIYTLQRVYPVFEYTLMLSDDVPHQVDLPIKSLQYDAIDDMALESYVNGQIQMATLRRSNQTLLYAPLRGKQGVYGVLQVIAFANDEFNRHDVEFIRQLANTAGSALENAKLYQQSVQSIEKLRLMNSISRRLNTSTNLKETAQFLTSEISNAFDVSAIGFIMIQEGEFHLLDGSSQVFEKEEGASYIDFVHQSFLNAKESLFISNLNERCPKQQFRFASLMAVPMIQEDALKGFCVVLHEEPYHFSFDVFKLFQSLIYQSAMALTNSMLREKLEKMVITDQLTQLFAKNYLNSRMEASIGEDEQGTLILLDIDNFKKVNDTYGHQTGDEILIQVARLIKENIRSTDVGARWGGEEMAIYLPGVSLETGEQVAKRLLAAVEKNTTPPITISCGVSYWNKEMNETVESLFKRADVSLYHAKNRGKNQVITTNNRP
ncbi:sensor domain-containing diguanylate cyclase [Heyndrickxia acidiproducens]|uniref:sensor domain-containing diguanylate cyclase n=1 Tax=Heyndrickxia acidiproducens TaxID=1121084 RepID=UPI0003761AC4|nr:diguanylate cyclase [Heyndrickxia acidiproducens]